MKKILFPIDFSHVSLNAFRFALHLAKKMNAEILTLHVYDVINLMPYTDYHNFIIEYYDVTEWDQFENYKDEVPQLSAIAEKEHMGHVVVKHILKRGDIENTILEMAAAENVDFIIMGTTGATGLKEVFLGSLTQKIMNNGRIPVIAIPEDCRYMPIKKIVFLTDYNLSQLPILKKVHNLALMLGAEIDVLQVSAENKGQNITFREEWEKIRPKSKISFHLIIDSDVESAINDFIEVHEPNLIALTIIHYGFFERLFHYSLSKKMAFHSQIPLLAIDEEIVKKVVPKKHIAQLSTRK